MAWAPPRHRWAADPCDDARAGAAADAIARQDWPQLGTLLTAAHRAGLGLREPVDADLLVDSALSRMRRRLSVTCGSDGFENETASRAARVARTTRPCARPSRTSSPTVIRRLGGGGLRR